VQKDSRGVEVVRVVWCVFSGGVMRESLTHCRSVTLHFFFVVAFYVFLFL
jgi:hypothetical protein